MSREQVICAIASGLYSGYVGPWTGTSGSIPPFLIAYFLLQGNPLVTFVVAIASVLISVWSAGAAEAFMGHDNRKIVIDEWAGYFVAILFVPYSLVNYVIAFGLFRILDVVKLWPARQLEKLPRGWGVTMDDVAAGVQTNLVLQLILLSAESFGA